jgi:hypothetical protein
VSQTVIAFQLSDLFYILSSKVYERYITTKVVSSNPPHDKVYSIQHNVIKFVGDLQQVCGII